MQLFNERQIMEIWNMQRDLDVIIRENNGIDDETDLNEEKYLALKCELFEFANEIESFKFWKKNKGKDHILEEACDMLHFIFSLAIDNDVKIEQIEEDVKDLDLNKYHTNEVIVLLDDMISRCYLIGEWFFLNTVLTFLAILLAKYEFTVDDLYNAYMEKNKVNIQRQADNY